VAFYRLSAVWEQAARLESRRSPSRSRWLAAAAAVILLLAGTVLSLQTGLFVRTPDATPAPVVRASDLPATTEPATAPIGAASPGSADESAASATTTHVAFQQRYVTAIGASRTVALPDGSRITLDTDSRIQVQMNARSRTVRLERGQAFFEVAHDAQRPFIVDSGRLSVVAVGTAFSVRREGPAMRVVVADGTVRLERPGERNDMLPAGGIARIQGEEPTRIHQGQAAELERNLSWRSGVLTFRRTPLSEAVAEFNRYGTRRIVIRDPRIATLELGGVFRSGDVEVFARLLETTFSIDATLHPDRIELSARRFP
jgi:ferric-dicitrate binding protein FerR (iron transport regulator)